MADAVRSLTDDSAGHRFGHLRGKECAHEVQDGCQRHRGFWFDGAGCDGRGHGIRGVVETVSEIEK